MLAQLQESEKGLEDVKKAAAYTLAEQGATIKEQEAKLSEASRLSTLNARV